MMNARAFELAVAGVLAAQIALAAALSRASDLGAQCLSRSVLGIDCPMCGMTRSFVAFAHGRVGEAFDAHPLGPVLFVASAAFAMAVAAAWARSAPPILSARRTKR